MATAQKTVTETIEGLTVECTRFTPWELYDLNARLVRVLGPAIVNVIVPLLAEGEIEEAFSSLDVSKFSQALSTLQPNEVIAVSADVLRSTTVVVRGERVDLVNRTQIDVAFDEAPGALLPTVWFALKHNLRSFYSGVARNLPAQAPKKAKKAQA